MIGTTAFNRHVKSCKGKVVDNIKYEEKDCKYICILCGREFDNKSSAAQHYTYCSGARIIWNKGLDKNSDYRVNKQSETFNSRIKNGIIIPSFTNRRHTDETRHKIRLTAQKNYLEGRSGWCFKPSYPEIFFMKLVEDNINNLDYLYNYPIYGYFLDFAWVKLKKYIEIDGSQHYANQGVIDRDIKRDKLICSNGWKVLRIKWIDLRNDSDKYIDLIRNFIDNVGP
jgi:very-short-patch-repair endonuclease/DNA-directed RNA polymerase subunit RPC12/RpoP